MKHSHTFTIFSTIVDSKADDLLLNIRLVSTYRKYSYLGYVHLILVNYTTMTELIQNS
ncbi:hypothetical protein [Bacillus sp. FSL K6-0067]|uniref:hypothetical protein n=1 Tax=Bacillus sp. FSL K6-0067 TaxID=2921412 RepID=UPI0012B6A861|nr:hypothetical protein [Bacillus cereus]